MDTIMRFLTWLWDGPLDLPVRLLREWEVYDAPEGWPSNLIRTGFLVVIFIVLYEIYSRIRDTIRKRRLRHARMTGQILEPEDAYTKDSEFADQLDATQHPEKVIATLKARKDWKRLGEVHAGLNQPKEAAKWFSKAGDDARAGAEYAKAGDTKRAAQCLMKAGEYVTAARFFQEVGMWKQVAQAYVELGAAGEAAFARYRAGAHKDAAAEFAHYYAHTTDGAEAQIRTATLCGQMLRDAASVKRLDAQTANYLRAETAKRLMHSPHKDLAKWLQQQAGG